VVKGVLTGLLVAGVWFAPAVLPLLFLGSICAVREDALALPASVPGRRAPSKKVAVSLLKFFKDIVSR
jgi:hypothetical protein